MKTGVGIMVVTCVAWSGAMGCSHEEATKRAAPTVTEALPPPQPTVEKKAKAEPAPEAPPAQVARDDVEASGKDAIFFDFDSHILRDDARPVLQDVAHRLKKQASTSVRIEGNCDELGTTEYNLALGEERAKSAKSYLEHLGVAPGRVETISYGSERPKYAGHDETTRAKNRRDDFVIR